MDERIVHCLTLNSLALNVGSLNVATSRRLKVVLTEGQIVNYFKFADPEVSRIVAENWGDGIGTTLEQIEAVTDISTKFKENTLIESFDEFEKFNGVNLIGDKSFMNCANLKSIKIPPSVTSILVQAFKNTPLIESIGNTSNINQIGSSNGSGEVFMYSGVKECNYPNLEKLYGVDCWLGSRLEEIVSLGRIISIPGRSDKGTFESCENLKKVNFPTTIESIGERAFYNCTMLEIENISLPNLKKIGLYAFQGVKIKKWSNMGSITTVSFPGWTGGKTFGDISALEELIMPETLLIIENCGFKNYSNCKFKFSSSITSIGVQSFMNCSSIIDDVILPNLNTMGDGAFLWCTSLPTVSLSENISSIGSSAFENCTALQTVICKAVTPPTLGSDAFKNTNNCHIYVPDASVEAYKTATNWSTYTSQIKPINVADTLPDISTVAENDLYKIGEAYWKVEMVDNVLTWVEI